MDQILIWVVILTVFFSIAATGHRHSVNSSEELFEIRDGWYQVVDGKSISVTLPHNFELGPDEELVLYFDGLDERAENLTLLMRGAAYRPEAYLNGTPIFIYNDDGFARNQQMRSKLDCVAVLPKNLSNQQLALHFEAHRNGKFYINPVFIGTETAVFRHQYYTDLPHMLLVLAMWIIAIVCAGAHFYLKKIHMPDPRLANTSCFLMLCGIWRILDSTLAQQVSGQSPVVCLVSFYAFMTMVIPMIYFVRNTASMNHYRCLTIFPFLFYLNVIIQTVIHLTLGVEYISMLFATHLLQLAVCWHAAHLLQKEYKKTKNKELHAVLQSIMLLACATLIDLILYWMPKVSFYGFAFQIGILVFIIRLLCAITATLASNLQFKAEATVYKRLSREDRLTGLDNRRAFDEYFAELETTAETYQDIALIFLDLNGLKQTNDRYGHGAGDELIIGAAQCMKNAFSGKGTCYRIGGDEFAIVLPNPTGTPEEWTNGLDEAIRVYNQNNRHRLSLASGVSFLRDEEGRVKRPSDWKFEADQAMYRNKVIQKSKHQEAEV